MLVLAPSVYAGKTELTTYYPSPYGEYETLKSTNYQNIGGSCVLITARAIVGSTAAQTWTATTACPANYTIVYWGAITQIQYWGGGMTHWYAYCQQSGNGVQANLYTQNGYTGHYLDCQGLCMKT